MDYQRNETIILIKGHKPSPKYVESKSNVKHSKMKIITSNIEPNSEFLMGRLFGEATY